MSQAAWAQLSARVTNLEIALDIVQTELQELRTALDTANAEAEQEVTDELAQVLEQTSRRGRK